MNNVPAVYRFLYGGGIALGIIALAMCLPQGVGADREMSFPEQVGERIRERIALNDGDGELICRGELLCGIQILADLYEQRQHVPIWSDGQGLRPMALALGKIIQQSDQDGLRPGDYHLDAIAALFNEIQGSALPWAGKPAIAWAELDLLLTDAFVLLSDHLIRGRVDPETLHTDWVLSEPPIDIPAVLQSAVTEAQLDQVVERWRPAHDSYRGLRTALQAMRQVAEQGGWPRIPDGPTLRLEDRHARVLVLRHRLHIGGDLPFWDVPQEPERFDESLKAAVLRFQRRHGLAPDGLVGQKTLQALNVPVQQRIRRIELNLERWRWLPHHLGERHILINTADFSLRVVAYADVVMQMRVVVGRPARRTPVFSAPLSHMVINPNWTVPFTIAVEDILPRVRKDAAYLAEQGITVYGGWDEDSPVVDPWQIDWNAYSKRRFPFRLVQAPGPRNALGQIKFMFPNKFAVYLHDTPYRAQFVSAQRDFSSGCIRVENAVGLARYLLRDHPEWTPAKLQAALDQGSRQVVHVRPRWPVHLVYMTAWVDEDGVLQFREDIYGRDDPLDQALQKPPPAIHVN